MFALLFTAIYSGEIILVVPFYIFFKIGSKF